MISKQNSSSNPLSAGMAYSKHLINVSNEDGNEDGWCDDGGDGVSGDDGDNDGGMVMV